MTETLLIRNCRLDEGLRNVVIKGGRIESIAPEDEHQTCSTTIDAGGWHLLPGLIDLHLQGAGGADVIDGTQAALGAIGRAIVPFGTTGYLATTVYYPDGCNDHLKNAVELVGRDLGGAKMLGIHIEGPFVNRAKIGGLPADCICDIDDGHLDRVLDVCGPALKIMTVAPELPGALEVIEKLTDRGIIASFGHSDANLAQTRDGIAAGISHVTHLFNTMRPIHHRGPGPVPALLADPNVTVQMICDGAHVEASVIQMAAGLLGPDRLCVITDAGRALGSNKTEFTHAGQTVYSHDGILRTADGMLIGTAIGLCELTCRLARFAGWDILQAVRSASTTPAAVLGLANVGIEVGCTADLLLADVVDNSLTVKVTIIDGRAVYRADAS